MQMRSSALRGVQDFPQKEEGLRVSAPRAGMVVGVLV
jgi:hypothetical protein